MSRPTHNEIVYSTRSTANPRAELKSLHDHMLEMDFNDNYELLMSLFRMHNVVQLILNRLDGEALLANRAMEAEVSDE